MDVPIAMLSTGLSKAASYRLAVLIRFPLLQFNEISLFPDDAKRYDGSWTPPSPRALRRRRHPKDST
jgi:hypothetical protein